MNVQNAPKINRELSVNELKALLEKAYAKIAELEAALQGKALPIQQQEEAVNQDEFEILKAQLDDANEKIKEQAKTVASLEEELRLQEDD